MITPVDFATHLFTLNGMPFSIPENSMRHLYPIYNKPSNAKMFKFGRQTHKSTTIGNDTTWPSIKYANYHVLYVAPTGNQVSVFSTDKLDNTIRGSDVITNHYFDSKTKDQISYKEFKNGSKIYLRSAYHTADSTRGISSDATKIDEIQDIVSDHIPVIEQTMSHSLAKWEHMVEAIPGLPMHLFNSKTYAGTPKNVENTMEQYWAQSTQSEWIIQCKHQGCKKYNYINENNVGDVCLICNKCGKPIFYRDGQWVAMNNDGFIDGYRLPQIVLNWVNNENNPEAWQVSVIQTRKIYSAEKFFNEVLALPYAAARHPISLADLKKCCVEDHDMIDDAYAPNEPIVKNSFCFAGIDWGKGDLASGTSYSILTIGTWDTGKYRVLFKKKYTGRLSDPLVQVKDMLRIINRFRCVLTIADTGDGRTSNAMMVKSLGASRYAEIYEHGAQKKKFTWNKDKGYYVMNRTQVMTDIIMEIKHQKVSFFRYDQFKEFTSDFTGIFAEYSEQLRMTKYDHSVPDDAFHSYMFSRIACMIQRGELSKYLSGGTDPDVETDDVARSLPA